MNDLIKGKFIDLMSGFEISLASVGIEILYDEYWYIFLKVWNVFKIVFFEDNRY